MVALGIHTQESQSSMVAWNFSEAWLVRKVVSTVLLQQIQHPFPSLFKKRSSLVSQQETKEFRTVLNITENVTRIINEVLLSMCLQ